MTNELGNLNRTIHAGVIVLNSETELLDVGQIDLIHALSKNFLDEMPVPEEVKAQALDIEFHWVNETGKMAKLSSGLPIQCTDSFATCPTLDIVLMGAAHVGYTPTEAEFAFMRKAYDQCYAFLSICGGFEAPCRAGLFEGKKVTAPRDFLGMLRQQNPGCNWVEQRWTRDGKLWTSGTLLNGLDLMMAFARETWGHKGPMVEAILAMGAWPVRSIEYPAVNGRK